MTIDTSTVDSTNSTASIPDWEELPCVQYGFPKDVGPIRAPKLRTIFEPIPEGASTASPIYLVPRDRYEQQDKFESGYEVSGVSSIAKELQDDCEQDDQDDRVLYPIHIESDEYRNEGPETLNSWFQEFVEDYLEIPFHTCTLFFSGGRSIHAHVPRFVTSEDDRERLKELASEFCDETGAKLDLSIYSPKSLFRLPGVEHRKSGLSKVEIESHWDNARIFDESMNSEATVPDSYASVLQHVFASQQSLTVDTDQLSVDDPHNLFRILDSEKTVLTFDSRKTEIETPLIEREEYPTNDYDVPEWAMYNDKEFSPYAYAQQNPRSVAIVEVKDGAFSRKHRRGGAPMIPVRFLGAVGCDGEYTKQFKHAPLQLSEGKQKDYQKWTDQEYEVGDHMVVIGGQSRSSIMLSVTRMEALRASYRLFKEDGGRKTTLEYLASQGYDTGILSSPKSTPSSAATPDGEPRTIRPARANPKTDAEELQQKAEQDGIVTLSHSEKIQVACRHLLQGWNPTWEWFEEQFGSTFKPKVTHGFLKGIVEGDDFDEYDHVEVPSKPV
ncbi:hypothetical protein HSBGL_0297 [Halapricum desulfuricans]|uniref:G protein gamma domain-containing protein n=1 Tax=Halapricum desulfuricans TaxID=2841257 RepID=A0A897NE85_9EURY|nr:hypothetical protein [Halapricum desulfuricans]QSG10734.1 hypothetical protein HSBGL_0297 [Halapricum desulfuricans]